MVFGAPPQNPNNISSLVEVKDPHPRYPKTPLLAYARGTVVWVFGATPQNLNNFFGIVQFKHHQQRNPKKLLLACGVQWYGCLERHPRMSWQNVLSVAI